MSVMRKLSSLLEAGEEEGAEKPKRFKLAFFDRKTYFVEAFEVRPLVAYRSERYHCGYC